MANSTRVQIADAVAELLDVGEYSRVVTVERRWFPRAEIENGETRITVWPGRAERTREDLGNVRREYVVNLLMQATLGEVTDDDVDESGTETDELDALAEEIEAFLAGQEGALDFGDANQEARLVSLAITDVDDSDWLTRRVYTVAIESTWYVDAAT